MSKPNPFLDFIRSVEDPRKTLLIWDVDLAIQPSMSTQTTEEQKAHMWELYEVTEGGVIFFTGRTHQSVNETFGHDYAGVFEHGCITRAALGQNIIFVAPEIDVPKMGALAKQKIDARGVITTSDIASQIRERSDLAVFIEEKNTSIALVHTLLHSENEAANTAHLNSIRDELIPVAKDIIAEMGLTLTHKVKPGGDAVEIVPIGPTRSSDALLREARFSDDHINLIHSEGISKSTYVHAFRKLYDPNRRILITGDSGPDIDAMIVGKKYDGEGVYVSNRLPVIDHLKGQFAEMADRNAAERLLQQKLFDANNAITSHIDHHIDTWPLIGATVQGLRDMRPKVMEALPAAGGMVPNLRDLN